MPDPDQASITLQCPACEHEFPLSPKLLTSVRTEVTHELHEEFQKRASALAATQKKIAAADQALKEDQKAFSEKIAQGVAAATAERETSLTAQSKALQKAQAELSEQRDNFQTHLASQVKSQLAEKEKQLLLRAKQTATEEAAAQLTAAREALAAKDQQLRTAREKEIAFLKKEEQLREQQEKLTLEVQQQVSAKLTEARQTARKTAAEEFELRIAEKERTIKMMTSQLEDAKRKAEQGSQQNQGKVLEQNFQNLLTQTFPFDQIIPVRTGVNGADLAQHVRNQLGQSCGQILHETKRTKNWSPAWIAKLKQDLTNAGASLPVLITQALPPEIENFGQIDGVWVTNYSSALPLIAALRQQLLEVTLAKGQQIGAQEKQQLLYNYLTGNEFRNRIESVVSAFTSMRQDLESEKNAMKRIWNKRERQLALVIDNMTGMVGDVQALSGNALRNLEALDLDSIGEN